MILYTLNIFFNFGNVWQPDAVELLQELLSKREVEIHIMELPENPWGKLSIHLYFDRMSLSYFLAHHKYCTFEQSEEILKENPTDYNKKYEEERWKIRFEDLLLPETETPILPPYVSSSLPPPEELYAVQVKHVVSPSEVCNFGNTVGYGLNSRMDSSHLYLPDFINNC